MGFLCLFVCLSPNFLILYSTVRYSIIVTSERRTVQYSTVQYSTVQYITVQYSIYWSGPVRSAPACLFNYCIEDLGQLGKIKLIKYSSCKQIRYPSNRNTCYLNISSSHMTL